MRAMRCLPVLCALVACGGDDAATPDASVNLACQNMGGGACFQLPTAPMKNSDGAPSAVSCSTYVPMNSTSPMSYTGNVGFFGTSNVIAGAQINVHTSVAYTSPIVTATSADDGTYTLPIPAGTPDVLWVSIGGPGALTTYNHGYRANLFGGDIPNFNLRLFVPANIEGAAGLVGGVWEESRAVMAGYAVDCERRVIEHAAVTVSSTPTTRTFVDGVSVFYGAPGAVPLAVPSEDRGDTADNGIFAILHLPPGDNLHVQVWGFVDEAAVARGAEGLTLIADHPLHIVANSVVVGDMHPNQR